MSGVNSEGERRCAMCRRRPVGPWGPDWPGGGGCCSMALVVRMVDSASMSGGQTRECGQAGVPGVTGAGEGCKCKAASVAMRAASVLSVRWYMCGVRGRVEVRVRWCKDRVTGRRWPGLDDGTGVVAWQAMAEEEWAFLNGRDSVASIQDRGTAGPNRISDIGVGSERTKKQQSECRSEGGCGKAWSGRRE